MNTITSSNFEFPGQLSKYKGKVRDVYELEGGILIIIATDHDKFNYKLIKDNSKLIIDTRRVYSKIYDNIVQA